MSWISLVELVCVCVFFLTIIIIIIYINIIHFVSTAIKEKLKKEGFVAALSDLAWWDPTLW